MVFNERDEQGRRMEGRMRMFQLINFHIKERGESNSGRLGAAGELNHSIKSTAVRLVPGFLSVAAFFLPIMRRLI